MTKKLIALVLVVACLFSFVVSCDIRINDNTTESSSEATTEIGEKVEVTTLSSSKSYKVYVGENCEVFREVQLSFFSKENQDIQDIPYIEVKDAFDFFNATFTYDLGDFKSAESFTFNYDETWSSSSE